MRKLSKQAGVAHLYALLAVVVIVVVGVGWYVVRQNQHKSAATSNTTANASMQTANTDSGSTSAVQQPLASGTSNTALNSDLQNLSSSLNQDNQNLSSTNQSFSDKQLTVSN